MGSLLDWGRAKLSAAPDGSCAFWVDVRQVLVGRGGLGDADEQILRDNRGREWNVVRYRANPFAGRRALSDSTTHTLVWCIGAPGSQLSDLTPFEDHLPRAHHIAEMSLRAFARELAPGLELPVQLDTAVRNFLGDADMFIASIAERHGRAPVTLTAALNVLVGELTGLPGGIDASNAPRALCSAALAFSGNSDSRSIDAVRATLHAIAEGNALLSTFLATLSAAEPAEIIATVHLGAALARLGVTNAGALLVAEGICPTAVFRQFEAEPASGQWSDLPSTLTKDDVGQLASWYETSRDELSFERLHRLIYNARPTLDRTIAEPVAVVRFASLVSAFDKFVESDYSAADESCLPSTWAEELSELDALVEPLRIVAKGPFSAPAPGGAIDQCARDFVSSPVGSMELTLAEAKLAYARLERLLPASTAESTRERLAVVQRSYVEAIDAWDHSWRDAIAADVSGYLSAPQQTWRRSHSFAENTKGQRWLLVFDGLRYDLWRRVLLPELNDAGFRLEGDDIAFSFLPSITEISRRTLIGATASIGTASEASLAEKSATQAGLRHSYQIKSEAFRMEREAPAEYNVRVFSWPDKQVHGDVMDMGTLVGQFRAWVREHLMPWVRTNVARADRIAISSDHGFVGLLPEDAVDISQGSGEERNLPRVIFGTLSPTGVSVLTFSGGGQAFTLAASRRWFRKSGGRAWQFAHGGSTLVETLVPFAELVPLAGRTVDVVFEGLPDTLQVTEGETVELAFQVTVNGGRDRAPSIEVVGHGIRIALELGRAVAVRVPITGEDGLTTVLVRVRADGRVVEERTVAVSVKLARIKRTQLDLDL